MLSVRARMFVNRDNWLQANDLFQAERRAGVVGACGLG